MDRERLKEVQQADLTESRVNEDFVDWMKTKGPTWLLVILVAVTAYLAMIRWRQHKVRSQSDAWAALSEASLPRSKEDVAEAHAKIFAVPQIALQTGAEQLLEAVQSGQPLEALNANPSGVLPADAGTTLDDEEREHLLARAEGMFRRVLDGDAKIAGDDGSLGYTLHAVHALNGLAAVAEARGDIEQARSLYERAATRADEFYPALAEQSRKLASTAGEFANPVVLAGTDDAEDGDVFPTPAPDGADGGAEPVEERKPAQIDPALRELVFPAADDA